MPSKKTNNEFIQFLKDVPQKQLQISGALENLFASSKISIAEKIRRTNIELEKIHQLFSQVNRFETEFAKEANKESECREKEEATKNIDILKRISYSLKISETDVYETLARIHLDEAVGLAQKEMKFSISQAKEKIELAEAKLNELLETKNHIVSYLESVETRIITIKHTICHLYNISHTENPTLIEKLFLQALKTHEDHDFFTLIDACEKENNNDFKILAHFYFIIFKLKGLENISSDILTESKIQSYLTSILLIEEKSKQLSFLLKSSKSTQDINFRWLARVSYGLLFSISTNITFASLSNSIERKLDLRQSLLFLAQNFLIHGKKIALETNVDQANLQSNFNLALLNNGVQMQKVAELLKQVEEEEKRLAEEKEVLAKIQKDYEDKFLETLKQFPEKKIRKKPEKIIYDKADIDNNDQNSDEDSEQETDEMQTEDEQIYQTIFVNFDDSRPAPKQLILLNSQIIFEEKLTAFNHAETLLHKVDAGLHLGEYCYLNSCALLKSHHYFPENIPAGNAELQKAQSYFASTGNLLTKLTKEDKQTEEYQKIKSWLETFILKTESTINFYINKFQETKEQYEISAKIAEQFVKDKYKNKPLAKTTKELTANTRNKKHHKRNNQQEWEKQLKLSKKNLQKKLYEYAIEGKTELLLIKKQFESNIHTVETVIGRIKRTKSSTNPTKKDDKKDNSVTDNNAPLQTNTAVTKTPPGKMSYQSALLFSKPVVKQPDTVKNANLSEKKSAPRRG